jgi:hypothetical protein
MPQTATASFSLVVTPSPLVIVTTSLPNGQVGQAYSEQLVASGGTAPYVWSLQAGSTLPAGLTLSPSGLISGTPTAAGTDTIVIQVTDSGA